MERTIAPLAIELHYPVHEADVRIPPPLRLSDQLRVPTFLCGKQGGPVAQHHGCVVGEGGMLRSRYLCETS